MWKICLLRDVFATVPPALLCDKMKLCFLGKVNVKSHKAACLQFEAKQDCFLVQPGLMTQQSCVAWAIRKTKNPLPCQTIHLLSDIKVCMKRGIPGIFSGLREKVQLHRRTVLGSRPSVTSLGGVLLGRPPQNPFWSRVPLQRPHHTPSPPIKLFPSIPPCLSDPSLLVLFLMPLLGASGGSRTTAVLIPRLPTSTPTLAKRFLRVPVSYPHYHVASAEHPHGSHCPGDCTKSSKQDPKVGTVSFKLQTWGLRLREKLISGRHYKDSQDSSLDLSYSKEQAFPSNTLSWTSPAIKPFMD